MWENSIKMKKHLFSRIRKSNQGLGCTVNVKKSAVEKRKTFLDPYIFWISSTRCGTQKHDKET